MQNGSFFGGFVVVPIILIVKFDIGSILVVMLNLVLFYTVLFVEVTIILLFVELVGFVTFIGRLELFEDWLLFLIFVRPVSLERFRFLVEETTSGLLILTVFELFSKVLLVAFLNVGFERVLFYLFTIVLVMFGLLPVLVLVLAVDVMFESTIKLVGF